MAREPRSTSAASARHQSDSGNSRRPTRRSVSTEINEDLESLETAEYSDNENADTEFGPLSRVSEDYGRPLPGISTDHLFEPELPSEYDNDRGSFRITAVPAIGEEFGAARTENAGFLPRNIIGRDDRERIRDVSVPPFSWICYLNMQTPSGVRMIGTGWLAGPTTVVTAAHCAFSRERHLGVGWMQRKTYRVYAGASGSILAGVSEVESMFATTQWIQSGSEIYDFAVLRLKTPLGNSGHFQYANFDDRDLNSMLVNVVGYPYDKNRAGAPQMWGHADIIRRVEPQRLAYLNDTLGGNSGGPVINWQNGGQLYVVGIHNYGSSTSNYATRINTAVFNKLNEWRS